MRNDSVNVRLANDMLGSLAGLMCRGASGQSETLGECLIQLVDSSLSAQEPKPVWKILVSGPWRLLGADGVLADSGGIADDQEQQVAALGLLASTVISSVTVDPRALDLELVFENGLRFRSFSLSHEEERDCWFVLFPSGAAVAATSDLSIEFENVER